MHQYTAVIERCPQTKLYVGYIPGFPGAHSQGETLDELNANLKEVIEIGWKRWWPLTKRILRSTSGF